MKILRLTFLATVAANLFLFSCKREADVVTPKPEAVKTEVSVVGDRLAFKDRHAFEQYSTSLGDVPKGASFTKHLRQMEAKLNFFSMRAAQQDAVVKLPNGRVMTQAGIEDDYLASMLSPEGILQIGEWIFKLDLPNKKVYALHEKDQDLLDELKKAAPSHDKIRLFSTDDEVLLMLEDGQIGKSSAGRVSILCFRESGAGEQHAYTTDYYREDLRLDCKLVYQKAGVYFSIQAKCQYQNRFAGIWYSQVGSLGGSWGGEYKVKCGSWSYPSGSGTNGGIDEDGSSWNKRIYESASALNRYKIDAQFINYTEHLYTQVIHIEDNY